MKKEWTLTAYKATSAFTGIGIYCIEYGIDAVVLVSEVSGGEMAYAPRPCIIRYNRRGDSYFMHRGKREYLSEYMRADL